MPVPVAPTEKLVFPLLVPLLYAQIVLLDGFDVICGMEFMVIDVLVEELVPQLLVADTDTVCAPVAAVDEKLAVILDVPLPLAMDAPVGNVQLYVDAPATGGQENVKPL